MDLTCILSKKKILHKQTDLKHKTIRYKNIIKTFGVSRIITFYQFS